MTLKFTAFTGMAVAILAGAALAEPQTEAFTPAESAKVLSVFLNDQEPSSTNNEALTAERWDVIRAAYDEVLSGDDARVVIAQR